MAYITTTQAQNYGVQGTTQQIQGRIDQAEVLVNSYLKVSTLLTHTETETVKYSGASYILRYPYNIRNIQVNNVALVEYKLVKTCIVTILDPITPDIYGYITISYTVGYDTTPSDVVQAMLMLVKKLSASASVSIEGAKKLKQGDLEIEYAEQTGESSSIFSSDIKSILWRYKTCNVY